MKAVLVKTITLIISLAAAVAAFGWWFTRPVPVVKPALPGMDNVPPGARNKVEKVKVLY